MWHLAFTGHIPTIRVMHGAANLAFLNTARITQLDIFQTIGAAMAFNQRKIHIWLTPEQPLNTGAGTFTLERHYKLFILCLFAPTPFRKALDPRQPT